MPQPQSPRLPSRRPTHHSALMPQLLRPTPLTPQTQAAVQHHAPSDPRHPYCSSAATTCNCTHCYPKQFSHPCCPNPPTVQHCGNVPQTQPPTQTAHPCPPSCTVTLSHPYGCTCTVVHHATHWPAAPARPQCFLAQDTVVRSSNGDIGITWQPTIAC